MARGIGPACRDNRPRSSKGTHRKATPNHHGLPDRKAIGWLVRQVHHDLEGMGGLGLGLEMRQRWGEARVGELDLDQEPWLALKSCDCYRVHRKIVQTVLRWAR